LETFFLGLALIPHACNQAEKAWSLREDRLDSDDIAEEKELEEMLNMDPLLGGDTKIFRSSSDEKKKGPRGRAWWFTICGVLAAGVCLSWMLLEALSYGSVIN